MNWPKVRLFHDRYEYAHREGIDIHEAAEIAEARRSGRRMGVEIHVTWHPGKDAEIDSDARWLLEHGPSNGVVVDIAR